MILSFSEAILRVNAESIQHAVVFSLRALCRGRITQSLKSLHQSAPGFVAPRIDFNTSCCGGGRSSSITQTQFNAGKGSCRLSRPLAVPFAYI